MKEIKMSLMVFLSIMLTGLACATEYFVDGSRPDDSGDGLTVLTAKRTIQAAIDLTKPKDIVTVLPGIYGDSEGSRTNPADGRGQAAYRIVITNQVLLRSRDGAEKTVIQGRRGSGADGLGTGAIRGVYMRGVSYAAVEGFTITGCASVETAAAGQAHYGTAVTGNWNSYVLGCILSNNVSVAGTVYTCTAVATLFIDNTATGASAIGVNSHYWNCVMANNNGESPLLYTADIANCTVVDHSHGAAGGHDCTFYNCVLVGNGRTDGSSQTTLQGSVTDSAAQNFKTVDPDSVCDASRFQHVAPAFCDWRLRTGSDALGRGTMDGYNAVVNAQKIRFAVSQGYLPQTIQDRYVDRDFAGNLIVANDGKIDAGAIQGAMTVASGIVVFNERVTGGASATPCRTYSYASTEAWPSVISCKGYSALGKPMFYQKNTGDVYPGGAGAYKYPGADGQVSFGLPPAGYIITNSTWFVNSIVYAKPDGDDNATGEDPDHAFRTVKKAVEVASTRGSFSLVRLLPGVYAEGTTNVYGLAARFFVDSKSLRIESTDGAEKTFVVGAASAGSEHLGLGPDAVRCVSWYTKHNDASVCGITFCGGRTDYRHHEDGRWDAWESVDKNVGGAVYVKTDNAAHVHFQDCVFSNNCALIAAVALRGEYQRCRFIGNTVANASGSICRNGDYTCCEFLANDSKNYTLDNTSQNFYFCTVEGCLSPSLANVYGSIVFNPGVQADQITVNGKVYDGNVVPEGYTVTAKTGVTGTRINYLQADPSFVEGQQGGQLWNYSAAVGGANVADLTNLTLNATLDLDGNGLFLREGYPSAGARQYPMQAVYVSGPEWGVTVNGGSGTVGTNAVTIGSSITVEAFQTVRNRKFLGFTVNGDELPYSGLTYTHTVSADLTEAVPEIFARYSKGGLVLLFR